MVKINIQIGGYSDLNFQRAKIVKLIGLKNDYL